MKQPMLLPLAIQIDVMFATSNQTNHIIGVNYTIFLGTIHTFFFIYNFALVGYILL